MKEFDINNIQLSIQSPGTTINESLEQYLISQIEKLGKKYSRIEKCEMVLRTDKNNKSRNCVAEAKLFVPNKVLFAKGNEENFRIAARNTFEDLSRQLDKFKGSLEEKNKNQFTI